MIYNSEKKYPSEKIMIIFAKTTFLTILLAICMITTVTVRLLNMYGKLYKRSIILKSWNKEVCRKPLLKVSDGINERGLWKLNVTNFKRLFIRSSQKVCV